MRWAVRTFASVCIIFLGGMLVLDFSLSHLRLGKGGHEFDPGPRHTKVVKNVIILLVEIIFLINLGK